MRKTMIAAWLALSCVVLAVPAASQVSLPQLAPGEVLLEISAIGTAHTPATSATLTLSIRVEGKSDAEARQALDSAIGRATAAARGAGIAAADIEVKGRGVRSDPHFDPMLLNMTTDWGNSTTQGPEGPARYGSATINLRIRNPAGAADLHRRLSGLEGVDASAPDYRLDDDSAARREARADAVRRARADAEAYAASMNMRVARVLRVTERGGLDVMSMMLGGRSEILRELEGGEGDSGDGRILTHASIGVDYALAPR